MTNTLQKKLYESGYLIVKNILDYRRDLKPVLNDMEFVMDCLIQKYAKKTKVKKVLNLNFKRKYSYISKLNINDLDQYFNTRLPRDHVKRDSDYFATQSLWNLITNKRILDVLNKPHVEIKWTEMYGKKPSYYDSLELEKDFYTIYNTNTKYQFLPGVENVLELLKQKNIKIILFYILKV